MNKLIYTSLSPNTKLGDVIESIKILQNPLSWYKKEYQQKIKTLFETKFSNYFAYSFNYARSGMYVLFNSLGLEKDDEVIVQGFTCIAAVNPVIKANLKPLYTDIDVKTLNMSVETIKQKITKKTKAVMFQYTFGNSQGIEEISKFCRENNLILIEDCTNTIFGKHNDNLIGSYGDASIFSFGRDKAVSGVNGGLILIKKDSEFLSKFEQHYNELGYPSFIRIVKDLLYNPVWYVIKKTYNIHVGKLIHFITTLVGITSLATSEPEKTGKMPNELIKKLPGANAQLTHYQLNKISKMNKHRNKLTNFYKQNLNDLREVSLINFNDSNCLLRFPILVTDNSPLFTHMKSKNILLGDWYDKPVTPARIPLNEIGYTKGECKTSEEVCNKIVNLPTHVNLSMGDAKKIVNEIKKFYGN